MATASVVENKTANTDPFLPIVDDKELYKENDPTKLPDDMVIYVGKGPTTICNPANNVTITLKRGDRRRGDYFVSLATSPEFKVDGLALIKQYSAETLARFAQERNKRLGITVPSWIKDVQKETEDKGVLEEIQTKIDKKKEQLQLQEKQRNNVAKKS